ncbi:hypothetical protein GCM10007876_40070 [Litoribrevibacter albus]|uniref:Uncharacterized protein n=1 Tax=Litoribrevibacter albus TaxID=1473156 RepID=A0AA37SF93_9GAMM|nr:hypothetical protein GCM10007876_40070 [Litoribrevibacter albus]
MTGWEESAPAEFTFINKAVDNKNAKLLLAVKFIYTPTIRKINIQVKLTLIEFLFNSCYQSIAY